MKVLHIATSVVAQSASYRIHQGILLNQEIDSKILVTQPSIKDRSVIYKLSIEKKIKSKIINFLEGKIFNSFFREAPLPFSTGLFSALNYEMIENMNPDIIHLHWICGSCVSMSDFSFLSKFNIVWTLHDSWPFMGGCHIPFSCNKYQKECFECEQLKQSKFIDLSNLIWKKKHKYYKDVDVTIVTPSRWMSECAKKSALLGGKKINVIPNGMNIGVYKPIEKKFARSVLNIESGKRIILFGAVDSTSDENKGFKYLQQAMNKLKIFINQQENVEIIVFGSHEPKDHPDFGYKTTYIGRIYDDITLSILYSAADVMVVPSKSESFGQTAMEALACGTPCVAFKCTGLVDIIDHKKNGYLAIPFEAEDLSRGIAYVLEDEERWKLLSNNARQKVIDTFDINIVVKKYINLYEEILESRR